MITTGAQCLRWNNGLEWYVEFNGDETVEPFVRQRQTDGRHRVEAGYDEEEDIVAESFDRLSERLAWGWGKRRGVRLGFLEAGF